MAQDLFETIQCWVMFGLFESRQNVCVKWLHTSFFSTPVSCVQWGRNVYLTLSWDDVFSLWVPLGNLPVPFFLHYSWNSQAQTVIWCWHLCILFLLSSFRHTKFFSSSSTIITFLSLHSFTTACSCSLTCSTLWGIPDFSLSDTSCALIQNVALNLALARTHVYTQCLESCLVSFFLPTINLSDPMGVLLLLLLLRRRSTISCNPFFISCRLSKKLCL